MNWNQSKVHEEAFGSPSPSATILVVAGAPSPPPWKKREGTWFLTKYVKSNTNIHEWVLPARKLSKSSKLLFIFLWNWNIGIQPYGILPGLFLWNKEMYRKKSLETWIQKKSYANPQVQRRPKHVVQTSLFCFPCFSHVASKGTISKIL